MIEVRFFVAIPRSGSTLVMQIMSQNKDIAVTSRLVLMGNKAKEKITEGERKKFVPDYSVLESLAKGNDHIIIQKAKDLGKKFLVNKEEVGNNRLIGTEDCNECNYNIFQNIDNSDYVKPIFIIREPVRTFDGWKKRGWRDLASFLLAYENIYRTFCQVREKDADTFCVVYEYMVTNRENQRKLFSTICERWGIVFDDKMLSVDSDFAKKFLFQSDRERDIYLEHNPRGLFDTIKNNTQILSFVPNHGLVTTEEALEINKKVLPLYNEMKEHSVRVIMGFLGTEKEEDRRYEFSK